MTDAPGLKRRGNAYYWVASQCTRADISGFSPKTLRLSDKLSIEERASLCRRLKAELLLWITKESEHSVDDVYDGTLASLANSYEKHPQSPFQRLRPATQVAYLQEIKPLRTAKGKRKVASLTAIDFQRWYDEAKRPLKDGDPERVRRAHGLMTMLRILIKWGAVLRHPGCDQLLTIITLMRFGLPGVRQKVLTYDHAKSIIDKAHEEGRSSIALAQAIQFETALRQWDVIGHWDRIASPQPGDGLVHGNWAWRYGLTWGHIDSNMILRKKTSKTGSDVEFDLKLSPMVMAEINRIPVEKRVGPLILDESSGLPYMNGRFSRVWRKVATAAGVPSEVWNRDSRAGGISEGRKAGASLDDMRQHAGHSDVKITSRYDRGPLETTSKVAILRQKAREQKS